MSNELLGIELKQYTKLEILEQIKKYIVKPAGFFHIVSLNPENLVVAQEDQEFKKIIETAQIKLIDGIGVVLSAKFLGIEVEKRLTGIELMQEMVKLAGELRLRVLLIGGRPNLALTLSKCYGRNNPEAKFIGINGISNIKKPLKSEEKAIFSIVSTYKPQIILAAFGSPYQELWFYKQRERLKGIVCLGVGQGFDVALGVINRAPAWMRKMGLEWLYRLLTQPWRWKRQIRLIKFSWLIFKEKFLQT